MQNLSPGLLRFFKKPPQVLYALGLGSLIGWLILLLTTTGRKSGLKRVTPLQYERVDDVYYVGSARGTQADWFRNLAADPRVEVRIGRRRFSATARHITDPEQVIDFLELRLRHRPRMVRAILKSEGIPIPPSRDDLTRYAEKTALVAIYPDPA